MEVKFFPVDLKPATLNQFLEKKKRKLKHAHKPSYPSINPSSLTSNLLVNNSGVSNYIPSFNDEEPEKPKKYQNKKTISSSYYRK